MGGERKRILLWALLKRRKSRAERIKGDGREVKLRFRMRRDWIGSRQRFVWNPSLSWCVRCIAVWLDGVVNLCCVDRRGGYSIWGFYLDRLVIVLRLWKGRSVCGGVFTTIE